MPVIPMLWMNLPAVKGAERKLFYLFHVLECKVVMNLLHV